MSLSAVALKVTNVILQGGTVDDVRALGYTPEEIQPHGLKRDFYLTLVFFRHTDWVGERRSNQQAVANMLPLVSFFVQECGAGDVAVNVLWYSTFLDEATDNEFAHILREILRLGIRWDNDARLVDRLQWEKWDVRQRITAKILLDHGLYVIPVKQLVSKHREKWPTSTWYPNDNYYTLADMWTTRQSCRRAAWIWLGLVKRKLSCFGPYFDRRLGQRIASFMWETRFEDDWINEGT